MRIPWSFLYKVDAGVTLSCKALQRFLVRCRLRRTLDQVTVLLVVVILGFYNAISVIYPITATDNKKISNWGVAIFSPKSMVFSVTLLVVMSRVTEYAASAVQRFHVLFDPEAALCQTKLFGDGYRAWGIVIPSIALIQASILGYLIMPPNFITPVLGVVGGGFLIMAYVPFVERKDNRRKKKKFPRRKRVSAWLEEFKRQRRISLPAH